nr:metallophosphoesterase [Chelativorans xinjiangense]
MAARDLPSRRVVVIGDMHRRPGMEIEPMRWIGRYVAETRPDNVIQIGDFFDMESCEFHSAPGSASQQQRPAFQEDIESGEESLDEYHREVGIGEIPHDVVLGNHEFRVWRLEEAAPNLKGTLTLQLDQFFARYRWRVTPYRHWLFMEGVGFTHVPISIMGKPIGGRYPEQNIGNQSTHSIVFGHTHRWNHVTVPKIGINNSITVTNVGSAMPYGYIPKYADGATTGYSYGVAELRLSGGRVEGSNFLSMLDLQERYK